MRHLCFTDTCEIDAVVISKHFLKELVERICPKIKAFSVKLSFYLSLHLFSWFVVVKIQENICSETILTRIFALL